MSNPIISKADMTMVGEPLTIQGVIKKSVFLLSLCAVTALGLYFYGMSAGFVHGAFFVIAIFGMLATIVTGLIMYFKPNTAPALAIPYAMFEGLFVGGVSGMFALAYPGLPIKALLATFVSAATMFALYRSGLISVNAKFRSVITSATIAIMIVYVVQWVLRLAFGTSIPGLFDGGLLAIGFSAFVCTIATLNLLLDFDNIERAAAMGVSNKNEWLLGVGLLATLVWMYIEFIRLLGFLEE